jgi:hypothetical protein
MTTTTLSPSPPKQEEPKGLQRINQIEDPANVGKKITSRAVISSTSITYAVPRELEITFERGDKQTIEIPSRDCLELARVSTGYKQKLLVGIAEQRRTKPGKIVAVEETGNFATLYWLRVRPEVLSLQFVDGKTFDEAGFEYKAFDVYVLAKEKQLNFQPSQVIELHGIVLPEPNSQRIVLLATNVEFPSQESGFDRTKLHSLKAKLDTFATVQEKLDWILSNFAMYSRIIGRSNIAEAMLLCYFTPLHITFENLTIRGWGNVLALGDSTVAKSDTARKLNRLLHAGVYLTAETATQAGLTATTVQMEHRGWFVDWGFLVLEDRRLLIIDGAHRLSRQDWSKLAESERQGTVIIAKASKDQAYARTRQIKIANALNRETFESQIMQGFLYSAQALPTVLDKTNIARLDLAVFAKSSEVAPESVNKKEDSAHDSDLGLLSESLRFCWSSKADVEFTQEAYSEILTKSTELYNKFHSEEIPLVSIDMKHKLARLSAAAAFLTLSDVDQEFRKITVTKEHIEALVSFLQIEYTKAGLDVLSAELKGMLITEEEAAASLKSLARILGPLDSDELKAREVVSFIVLKARVTKDELVSKFQLAEKSELRPLLAELQNQDLIRQGSGFYPTPRMIELYRKVIAGKL